MAATHKGLMEIACVILKTWHDGLCTKDDAKAVLLCLLRAYSDSNRAVKGRPRFDIHVSSKALASSAPKHIEHAVPLNHIAETMIADAQPGKGSPVVALLNMFNSLAQVVMLETEHAKLNKSKKLKQEMPKGWKGDDLFVRYEDLTDFQLSGATLEQVDKLQKQINIAEGHAKAKRTRVRKKADKKAV